MSFCKRSNLKVFVTECPKGFDEHDAIPGRTLKDEQPCAHNLDCLCESKISQRRTVPCQVHQWPTFPPHPPISAPRRIACRQLSAGSA
ncbi:unnamed protein product [Chondrus crispus]|uniref:Uncharacterized protein n=1 Tax=Chondrus crispus TaxID=2769 RepID=R7QJX9_CHOCR|nr:unnamed protein product [Chondrus crispus]CDF38028.1 unnamed protein product [Chondrus crispus]|eukprot:XP_005717897.1 unnamed protein product [Chondrus crispus]